MRRTLLFLLLACLASCSKGPQADLEYIGDARSLAAEWALVNEQAAQGKLTSTYVDSMHQWLRQQLQTDSKALTQPNAGYAAEIEGLLKQPDDASPDALRGHADRLKQYEDALESA
ncbi:MAG: hypothetical protein ACM3ZV_06535 [Bacillota bacterium]